MNKILYIDTNIYLRFFDSNSSQFKQLLKSLEEAKEAIFVTQQIVDETDRNKLDVFLTSVDIYIKQFGLSKISLPEHLETDSDGELKEWNKNTKLLDKASNDQNTKLKKIMTKLIKEISENTDEVSIILAKIFMDAHKTEKEFIEKARTRKELGNPPGKRNDPIGDQLSWEQLLNQITKIDEIWFISNDTDYLCEFNKVCYLNPYLSKELKFLNPKIKIHAFNTLVEGLTSYNKNNKISALPSEILLTKIKEEEKISNEKRTRSFSRLDARNFNYRVHNDERLCPYCNTYMSGPYLFNTSNGKVQRNYICPYCNNNADSGKT